ncbi:MAG: cadherin-like beta sandwich domain-containing protein [Acutalibacteraceae bacterium]
MEARRKDGRARSRIETNKRHVTDIELRALAQVFGVRYASLLSTPPYTGGAAVSGSPARRFSAPAARRFCTAAAQENGVLRIEQAPETVRRGSAFRITLAPVRQAAAFVLFAEYDAADIERAEAAVSGGWDGDYTYVSAQEGRVAVVYTAEDGRAMPAGARITFTFKTHSGALWTRCPCASPWRTRPPPTRSRCSAHHRRRSRPGLSAAPSSNSALLSLLPPEGALSPAFDPDIFDYTLEVPHTCASLVFDAVPADGASVRVNRKNLGAPGSTVDFEFTVTAADGKTKSTYTVAVTRLKKDETGAPAESTDSRLVSLTPPAGQLVPDFDPEILDYTLDVPFSSVSLTFDAVPADGKRASTAKSRRRRQHRRF